MVQLHFKNSDDIKILRAHLIYVSFNVHPACRRWHLLEYQANKNCLSSKSFVEREKKRNDDEINRKMCAPFILRTYFICFLIAFGTVSGSTYLNTKNLNGIWPLRFFFFFGFAILRRLETCTISRLFRVLLYMHVSWCGMAIFIYHYHFCHDKRLHKQLPNATTNCVNENKSRKKTSGIFFSHRHFYSSRHKTIKYVFVFFIFQFSSFLHSNKM